MSQDTSIGQVWASNYGTDGKPDGVGEVWIANASAITGGGGGGDVPSSFSADSISSKNIVGIGGLTTTTTTSEVFGSPSAALYSNPFTWDTSTSSYTGQFSLGGQDNFAYTRIPLISGWDDVHYKNLSLDIPEDTELNVTIIDQTSNTTSTTTALVKPYRTSTWEANDNISGCYLYNSAYSFEDGHDYSFTVDTSDYGVLDDNFCNCEFVTATLVPSSTTTTSYDPNAKGFSVASGIASATDFVTINGISLSSMTTGAFTGVNVSTSLTGNGKDIPLGINSPIVQQNNESTASFNQYGISINDGYNEEYLGVSQIRQWNKAYPMSVVATSSEATASDVVYVVTGSNP